MRWNRDVEDKCKSVGAEFISYIHFFCVAGMLFMFLTLVSASYLFAFPNSTFF